LLIMATPAVASGSLVATFVIGHANYTLNGQIVTMDAAPYISNGRTLIPVRYLADILNAQTNWDGNAHTVTVTGGSTTIKFVIGNTTMTVNGQPSHMDTAPVINNGRTYLPARYVAEALGTTVNWDAPSQTVAITSATIKPAI